MFSNLISLIDKRWRQKIYILLALIPLAIGLTGFITLMESPYLGLEFEAKSGKWFIASVDPHGPAARYPELVRKELVAIGDWKIEPVDLNKQLETIRTWGDLQRLWLAQTQLSRIIQKDLPLRITVQDSAQVKSFTITPADSPVLTILSKTYSILIIVATYLLLGLIILAKRPDDQSSFFFYLTCILVSVDAVALMPISFHEVAMNGTALQWFYLGVVFADLFATSTLFHFFLIFPKDFFGLNKNKSAAVLLYLIPAVVLILYWPRLLYFSYHIFIMGAIILAFYVIIKSYSLLNLEERAQMKWIYYALALFIGCDLFLYFVPLFFVGHGLIKENQNLFISLLLPLSMAFAILKYRLMDIDTLFDNTLIYSATLGVLAFIDITVISVLTNLKILNFSVNQPMAVIAGVWVIIFAYVPVRDFIRNRIRKLLKREVYDINQVSLQLSRDLLSATDIQTSFEKVMALVQQAMHPKGAEAFLFDGKDPVSLVAIKGPSMIPFTVECIKKLSEPMPLYRISCVDSLPGNYTGGVVLPVIGTREHLGCIVLQNKHSDRLYDREDVKLLNIAAGQLALHIEALREIKRKEQETFLEKERISREIHDGIGSSFTKAILIADMMGQKPHDAGNDEYSRELKKTLSEGLSELRTLIWTVDETECSLQDLVLQISDNLRGLKDKGDIVYQFHRKVIDDDRIAPPLLRRNILRIVSEALTNVIKHAGATRVDISLIYDGNNLTLKIRDNGKGCSHAKSNSPGHGLKNMRKRCEEMGGRFALSTGPLQGTEISMEVDL